MNNNVVKQFITVLIDKIIANYDISNLWPRQMSNISLELYTCLPKISVFVCVMEMCCLCYVESLNCFFPDSTIRWHHSGPKILPSLQHGWNDILVYAWTQAQKHTHPKQTRSVQYWRNDFHNNNINFTTIIKYVANIIIIIYCNCILVWNLHKDLY